MLASPENKMRCLGQHILYIYRSLCIYIYIYIFIHTHTPSCATVLVRLSLPLHAAACLLIFCCQDKLHFTQALNPKESETAVGCWQRLPSLHTEIRKPDPASSKPLIGFRV